jgi:hypothetical protein
MSPVSDLRELLPELVPLAVEWAERVAGQAAANREEATRA